MWTYLIRRILYAVPILLGTTLILFVVFKSIPGDPATIRAGRHATAEQIETIRKQMGLDRPYYVQYFKMLEGISRFDFGRSTAFGDQKVIDVIKRGAGVSFLLTAPPFFISILISILIGSLVALNRGTWFDKSAVAVTVGMQSVSVVVYIIAGQYLLAYLPKSPELRDMFESNLLTSWMVNLFQISGYDPSLFGKWQYFYLPWIILIALSLAPQVRFYRTIVLDELYQDYVRTARSKGLGTRAVMLVHVLKNAMIPIITDVVLSIPFLILGALLIESFFSIPGIGDLVVRAIQNSDTAMIMAITILGTVAYIVFNIISDLLYALVDPRVQLK